MSSSAQALLGPENEKKSPMLYFPEGLPGLEPHRYFQVGRLPGNDYFLLLQVVDSPELALILVDPYPFYPHYRFQIEDTVKQELRGVTETELLVFTTVTAGKDALYTNLAAPILISPSAGLGKQLILTEYRKMLRAPLEIRSARVGGERKG
ncbi:MAG: flagellar assembly protein FliW [Dethiobacteria bacterium]